MSVDICDGFIHVIVCVSAYATLRFHDHGLSVTTGRFFGEEIWAHFADVGAREKGFTYRYRGAER
ncbi:hypothetical protein [Corynebacterium glucuronolyticum]|uniref:hypothetical protein n=1 Tax=Corynebacterium glucuronolyticum TaxID=39791 RepID=UPI00019C2176|nr:hypothetical protein [Corynebacterium glucuronolyticum]EEI27378.1 hypothetical protein HMPREF0294_1125 [Corynebacterium glucuronolyticum ATCC 51867]QRO83477.1 hypothetical protein I6J20_04960 [Corynebacterium glucuronolyticum]